ncbi:glycosyltransferase, partial [Campylobacter jejuni]
MMNYNTPKVSIVVPSLNSISYIRECIDSILNQTLKDIEILCIDANSTDGTLEVLK